MQGRGGGGAQVVAPIMSHPMVLQYVDHDTGSMGIGPVFCHTRHLFSCWGTDAEGCWNSC